MIYDGPVWPTPAPRNALYIVTTGLRCVCTYGPFVAESIAQEYADTRIDYAGQWKVVPLNPVTVIERTVREFKGGAA